MQHDSARSLKLHVLFTVRRSLKVSEPCPYPPSSNPRPASRSRTCDLRSIADGIPSRARRAIPSRSRRTSSRTGTTFCALSSATATKALASGSSARSNRSGTISWEGRFEASALGRWQFTIEAWVDRYATLLDELDRKLAAGAERPERRAERGRGSVRPRRASTTGTRPRPSSAQRTGTERRRSRVRSRSTSSGSAPASERGTSSFRAAGAGSRASRRCCRSWPSSASTSSTCRPIHPIGTTNRKGRNNALTAEKGDPGEPVGDRRARRRPRCDPRRAWHAEGLRPARRGGAEARARDRARLRDPVLTRPPVAEGASGVVQPAAGRDAQVRREPAQALPGHLQRQLRLRGLARPLGGAAGRRPPLVPARCAGVSRRQSAHEVGAVLGVADRARCATSSPTRSSSPKRSRGRR